jgi:hypothetical protein
MAEKRLNVRYASTGGREIKREMEGIGETGEQAFRGIAQRAREMQQAVQDSLQQAARVTGRLGAAVSAVGAGIGAALKGSVNRFDELGKAASRVGLPVEALSELEYAAQLSGASLGNLETALSEMSRRAANAPAEFEKLGIAVRDAEGMRALMEEARDMGRTVSEETSKAAADFNDNLTRLTTTVGNLSARITESLLPALVQISDKMVEWVGAIGQLPPEVIEWFAKLAGIVVVGGPLLLGLSALLSLAGLLVSPFGLVAGAVALVVAALIKFWPEIQIARERVVEFVADASDAF